LFVLVIGVRRCRTYRLHVSRGPCPRAGHTVAAAGARPIQPFSQRTSEKRDRRV